MKRKSLMAGCAWLSMLGAAMWAGCSSGLEKGTLGGPCLDNGTCNSGLSCANTLCGPAMDSGDMSDTGIVDSGKKDTGKDTGTTMMDTGTGGCPMPADVSNFTPPAVHDPVTPSSVCSSNDTQQYYTDCINMYDQTK